MNMKCLHNYNLFLYIESMQSASVPCDKEQLYSMGPKMHATFLST